VLQRVYEALGGASWLVNDGWRPGLSCDTNHQDRWHGTDCAGGSIVKLELLANGLRGTIPTQIGSLPALKALAIESNPLLSGTLPTEIGALHALRTLSVHNNTRVSGSIPAQLVALSDLRFLSAHSCSLEGNLPQAAILRRLRYLDVSSNAISGHIPLFEQLSSVNYLAVRNNQLSGTISSSVGRLQLLQDRLHMNTNFISGTLPTEMGNLSQVPLPALHENRISGTLPTQLGSLAHLSFPSISYNMISGSVPTELRTWSSLHARLDLASNWLTQPSEQAAIDAAIVRRGQLEDVPRSWYSHHDRCEWRMEPAGKLRCSVSAWPTPHGNEPRYVMYERFHLGHTTS